jgi:hypothetical protein
VWMIFLQLGQRIFAPGSTTLLVFPAIPQCGHCRDVVSGRTGPLKLFPSLDREIESAGRPK